MPVVQVVRATRDDVLRHASMLCVLLGWFVYTRFFWTLHGLHVALPPCPFLAITGHPCPLCGGTRSFAAMWRGDVAAAARYHPLGPALFAGALLAGAILVVLLLSGRRVAIGTDAQTRIYVAGLAVLVAAWALRVALLPLPPS